MKAILIDGKPKVYTSIPDKWKHEGESFFNYHKLDPLIQYQHGWRDVVVPDYDPETQKLKDIYFDQANDNFTYQIEGMTQDELESRRTGNEVEQLNTLIATLQPFEKVVLRQAGLMEVIREQSLYEAFVILSNISPSGDVKTVKDQMMVILQGYQTPLK